MATIYLPGRGEVDTRVDALERAVKEYDPRLRVGRNEADGNWCVFIQVERGVFPPTDLYPVLGLGLAVEQLPSADEIKRRLYNADTLRHGYEILERMNRENQALKDAEEKIIKDRQSEAAVALEWGLRKMSNDIGKRRVQVNMGEPVKRRKHESR